jgi:hypothetical protein
MVDMIAISLHYHLIIVERLKTDGALIILPQIPIFQTVLHPQHEITSITLSAATGTDLATNNLDGLVHEHQNFPGLDVVTVERQFGKDEHE